MKKPAGIILVIVGVILLYLGWSRKTSLAGDVAELQAKVANKVDGGMRMPDHAIYLAGGAILAVAGVGLVLKK